MDKNEMMYQITMQHAKKLLQLYMINEIQYVVFKEKMLEKYNPKISKLLDTSLDIKSIISDI